MIQSGSFPSEPDHGRVSNAKAWYKNDYVKCRATFADITATYLRLYHRTASDAMGVDFN